MIRQAISCDICGSEKQQTNHWFVAHELGDELRVTGWNSRNRLRPGTKHLCGQTCLHKLVDEFVARTLGARGPVAAEQGLPQAIPNQSSAANTSLTLELPRPKAVGLACAPLSAAVPALARHVPKPVAKPAPVHLPAELVPSPAMAQSLDERLTAIEEPPRYASPAWRAEAWERERAREMRSIDRVSDRTARRRFTG